MKRILLVEDDPDGRRLLIQLLNIANIAAEGVGSAEKAVRLLDKGQYDAVIIDLMLPGIDGLELLKNIRRNPHTARLCCVAITAFDTPTIERQSLDIGFDAYFPKPLDVDTFAERLTRLMERKNV